MRRLSILLAYLIIVLLVVWLGSIVVSGGTKAGNLELMRLDGNPIDLASISEGKLVIVNFWATWCMPCIAEMPLLDSINRNLDSTKWRVLLVSDESVDQISQFKQSQNYELDFYKSESKLHEIGVIVLPKTVVFDQNGDVIFKKTGMITDSPAALLEDLNALEQRYYSAPSKRK